MRGLGIRLALCLGLGMAAAGSLGGNAAAQTPVQVPAQVAGPGSTMPLPDSTAGLPQTGIAPAGPAGIGQSGPGLQSYMDPDVVRVLISPDQETTLVASMTGQIDRLNMTLGSRFQQDEVLVGFECGEPEARAKIARAELRGARENLSAKTRLRALKAAGDVEVNLASAAAAKSAGEVELAEVLLERCAIEAPFTGRVARLYVKQFQGVNLGTPLADIISDGPLKVRLNAPSRWLPQLKVGMPFHVSVDETGATYPATVSAVGARVDAAAQAIEIEGRFDKVYPELLAGMSGTVHFSRMQ